MYQIRQLIWLKWIRQDKQGKGKYLCILLKVPYYTYSPIAAAIATTATTVIAAMLPLLPPPLSLLVMCLAWLQAKGQAKPGQNCWPDIGFGPAWQFSRPEPGPQAVAFTVTLSHNSDR